LGWIRKEENNKILGDCCARGGSTMLNNRRGQIREEGVNNTGRLSLSFETNVRHVWL